MGDFNSRSNAWGDKHTDSRGTLLDEWLSANRFNVHNDSKNFVPTFSNHNGDSVIDLVCSSCDLKGVVSPLNVLNDYENHSDHHIIEFNFSFTEGSSVTKPAPPGGWWNSKKRFPSFVKISLRLVTMVLLATTVLTAQSCNEIITHASNSILQTKIHSKKKSPAYWWTPEISLLRRKCNRLRRSLYNPKQRNKEQCLQDLCDSRKELKAAISRSKNQSWENMISDLDRDCWGKAYKIIRHRFKSPPSYCNASLTEDELCAVVEELFPRHPTSAWNISPTSDFPEITTEEVKRACSRLRTGKAAGPDNVAPEIAKLFVDANLKPCTNMFNSYLRTGIFPLEWKRAKLILLPKPSSGSKKYRPICLLNTLGKIFEQIIVSRLKQSCDPLSNNQFGFRTCLSTIDALNRVKEILTAHNEHGGKKGLAMLSLDIANAFNSLSWPDIVQSLESKNTPTYLVNIVKSYLSDRTISYGNTFFPVTSGVPQGSVLGPFLWNICYDVIVDRVTNPPCEKVAYADDVTAIFGVDTLKEVKTSSNSITSMLDEDLAEKQLHLAPTKTELCLLAGPLKLCKKAFASVKGCRIKAQPAIKYLGVWLDRQLKFRHHIRNICQKTRKVHQSLSCLLPNMRGPSFKKRKMILTAALSTLLYAVPVWKDMVKIKKYRDMLTRTVRPIKRSLCCAYRTVSNNVLDVLSGIPPIDLHIDQRCRQYSRQEDKLVIIQDILEKWATRWDEQSDQDLWFKQLIPDIRLFLNRTHGSTDFFMSQFFSGHGSFKYYLKRFHITLDDSCPFCGQQDTALHNFYFCHRFVTERRTLKAQLDSPFDVNNTQTLLLQSGENWSLIQSFVREVIQVKMNILSVPSMQTCASTPSADGVSVDVSGLLSLPCPTS